MDLLNNYISTKLPHASRQSSAPFDAEEWVVEMLERGETARTMWQGLVTPEMAKALLQLNVGNRPIQRSRVAEHIARLKAGSFILTHQGIAFSKDAQLNDGQHRLTAIVESGISAPLVVWFGCERDEFAVVDQNYARSAANILSIKGQPHAALRASICGAVLMLTREPHIYSKAQEVAAFASSMNNQDELSSACRVGSAMTKVTSPTAAGLAHFWILVATSGASDKLTEFWDGMTTGEALCGPRLRLREWLMRGPEHKGQSQKLTILRAAVIIQAWNTWVRGKKQFPTEWKSATTLPQVLL